MDGGIKFDVSANTAKFDADMGRVANSASTAGAKIKQAFSGLSGILAGGAALAGLKSLMDDFDRVGKLATRFGTSAESIQRVSVAADVAGTNIEQVANAMTKAGVAASQAAEKGGTMAETFARAGINAQKFANAQLDQKLLMVAEAFAAAGDDANKTNAIIEILGTRAGANLIPLISNVNALKQEMEGVSVASDEMVRKIEAANDRFTRLGNEGKVAIAGLLEGFTNTSERLGNVISDTDKLAKLLATLPLVLVGNAKPFWEVLQTGKTITELEEIEARATAISQLTREGVFGMDAVRNAELISERTKEILEQMRGTNQQISIAEDTTERVVDLEKEKTSELSRQAEQLERQERQRQDAIRSMEAEIALIEAKLSGNKELEASLREQADFQAALEKTGSFETAANFAATKTAERNAENQSSEASSSRQDFGGYFIRPEQDPLTEDQRVAQLRGERARDRSTRRVSEFMERGNFRTAIRAEERGERAANRVMDNQFAKDFAREMWGGRDMEESFQNWRNEMKERGGLQSVFGVSREDFDKWAREQARSERERSVMNRASREDDRQKTYANGQPTGQDPMAVIAAHVASIDEKLPLSVMSNS